MRTLIISILFSLSSLSFGQILSQGQFVCSGNTLSMKLTGSAEITLTNVNYNNQTNISGFFNTAKLSFTGTLNQQISGVSQVSSIEVDKTAGEVQLSNDIIVTGAVTMTNGDLNLNGKILDLSTSGSLINETNTNRVYSSSSAAYVKCIRTIGASQTLNPGNIGLNLTSTASMGTVEIHRRNEILQVAPGVNNIDRIYEVTVTSNNGSLNASFDFEYFNCELNGNTSESSLSVYRRPNSSSSWTDMGGSNTQVSTTTGKGIVNITGWQQFSEITLAYAATPLPIEMYSYGGKCLDGKSLIYWTTASEHNNDYFTLEKSYDGLSWKTIHTVEGAPNSTIKIDYEYTDAERNDEIAYYRISQTDFDGTRETYNPFALECISTELFKIYPNPNTGIFYVEYDASQMKEYNGEINIYGVTGALIAKRLLTPGKLNIFHIDATEWAPGMYLVRINDERGETNSKQVIIK